MRSTSGNSNANTVEDGTPKTENKAENNSNVKEVAPNSKSFLESILEAIWGIIKAIFTQKG